MPYSRARTGSPSVESDGGLATPSKLFEMAVGAGPVRLAGFGSTTGDVGLELVGPAGGDGQQDEREQGETHAGLRVGGRSIARLGRGVTASVHYIPPCTCYGGRVDLRCPHHGEGPQ